MFAIDVSGHLTLGRQLEVLKMKPAQRRRLAATMGRKVRTYSRKRLREQKDLRGRPWDERKKTSRRSRKMLRGMSKLMRLHSDPSGAEVGYAANVAGKIAYAHQYGVPERWNAGKARKIRGQPDYSAPCSRGQARALKQEGYTVRVTAGRKKKPTMKWITENLTKGKAAFILKMMRENGQSKKSWLIQLPERSFLGVDQREIDELANTVFDETLSRIKRA